MLEAQSPSKPIAVMSEKQQPLPAHAQDSDESIGPNDVPKDGELAKNAHGADPDFEERVELKYADCPEKTGFAFPS